MILYKNSLTYILLFILLNTVIKVIPLWTLRGSPIMLRDIYVFIVIFFLYLVWLWINNISLINLVSDSFNAVTHNMPFTPIKSV